jgi:lysophospholipase L1-like esterase
MSPKHRAERRPRPHLYLVLAAAAVFAVVGGAVLLWPPGPEPTASGEQVRSGAEDATEDVEFAGFDRIVFYGHSMPTGGGASDPALGYAERAAEASGLQLLNRAEGGTTSMLTAEAVAAFPKAGPQDVLVVHTGMNDIFRRGTNAVLKGRTAVRELLSETVSAKQRVLILECQPGVWPDTASEVDLQAAYEAWNEMLREEAAASTGVQLLDTCAEWDPEVYTDDGKFHPNDEGHALIAQELVALLRGQ